MSEIDPKTLVDRLITAIRLGEATGSRGRAASNIYNLADEAAALIQSQAAEIERLTRENGAFETGLVEFHRELSAAEADLATAREALEAIDRLVANNIHDNGTDINRMLVDRVWHTGPVVDASFRIIKGLGQVARAALPNTTGEAE